MTPVVLKEVRLERWLTAEQVADILGIAPNTVRNEWPNNAGLLRAARKFGRLLRFDAAAIRVLQEKARVQ